MNPALGELPAEPAGLQSSPRRLRVLVLDEYFPFPPDSGKPIRTWNLIRRLAARHEITFLCHGHPSAEQSAAARDAGIEIASVEPIAADEGAALYARLLLNLASPYPYSVAKHFTARFRHKLQELLRSQRFDLVHCEWTPYARYLNGLSIPTLIATHNIESKIWSRRGERASNSFARLFFHLQAAKMQRFERRALSSATAVTGVSVADADQARAWGARRVSVVDNGVDLEHFFPSSEGAAERAVFIGALDWVPNVDAVQFFADEVAPRIEQLIPGFKTKVIGRKAPESLKTFLQGRKGIEFAGEVPDTRPHLNEAGMAVVPLRIGGGSRLKILEALAMGKAVISTSIGAEGLAVTHRKNILLADTPEEFAAAVAELAGSIELRRSLGSEGRALVERSYGWDALGQKAEKVWLEMVKADGGTI
jgi:polysaccharide biosynthesis protein PslH